MCVDLCSSGAYHGNLQYADEDSYKTTVVCNVICEHPCYDKGQIMQISL